jgi:hypothetical protein
MQKAGKIKVWTLSFDWWNPVKQCFCEAFISYKQIKWYAKKPNRTNRSTSLELYPDIQKPADLARVWNIFEKQLD